MGLLKKLFGGGDSVAGLRKAVAQRRFADARMLAEDLLASELATEVQEEVRQLQAAAGDGLARLNLEEGIGLQSAGDAERAGEHFDLALTQVQDETLRGEIEAAIAATPLAPELVVAEPKKKSGGCSSCGPQEMEPLPEDDWELPDQETQFELILASYPPELAARYQQKGEQFRQAFLLSHAGQDLEALGHWQQVPAAEQDDLFWFELGGAQVRSGQSKTGRKSLEQALQQNPALFSATEMLVQLLVSQGEADVALNLLQQLLDQGQSPAFCHVQLTLLRLQQQQLELALGHARQALASGVGDADFLQLTASLLEQNDELAEAEAVLRRIPSGGGCGGSSMSLPLAEFLLRQQRELAKVLDTFNAACRQDPQNPRWQLRAAQTYLARNWKKEGLELLSKVVHDPQLEPELRQEAEQLLAAEKG